MPMGSFVILLPLDADYKILGYYNKEGKSEFEITNDLFLRLNLDHSKNEFTLLKLKDHRLFSYIYNFKGKLARKASGVIIGLLFNETDKPEKFRSALKEGAEAVEVLGLKILTMNPEQFEPLLKDIYLAHLEPLVDILKPEALKASVIAVTKLMLSGGKQERKIAQDLLKKVEEGEHSKITENFNNANNALKTLDYEKASKLFKRAAEIAGESFFTKTKLGKLFKSDKERQKFMQVRSVIKNSTNANQATLKIIGMGQDAVMILVKIGRKALVG